MRLNTELGVVGSWIIAKLYLSIGPHELPGDSACREFGSGPDDYRVAPRTKDLSQGHHHIMIQLRVSKPVRSLLREHERRTNYDWVHDGTRDLQCS